MGSNPIGDAIISSKLKMPMTSEQTSEEGAKSRLLRVLGGLSAMRDVEALIRSKLNSDAPLLSEIPTYLLELGGKRMRPALALLAGRALGLNTSPQALIDVSAGIELIHMATLLHDDIIDKSPTRRHRESALVKYGMENTLLSGDFLLVRAFSLCAHLDRSIIEATEQACIELTEGEILEVPLHRQRHDLDSSLTIARKKTAALFRLAAFSAAHIADAGPTSAWHMAQFGEKLGIAFQILDDILDVTSDENLLGKKSGLDLIERKPSVVNVMWLNSKSPLSARLLQPPGTDEEQFASEAITELREGPVVAHARALALQHVEEAAGALEKGIECAKHRDDSAVADLNALIEYTIARVE